MMSCHVRLERTPIPEATPATAELYAEHEIILRALAILDGVGERLGAGQPVDGSALAELVELVRAFADRCHHGKEEERLFPALRAGGAGDTLRVFLDEHEEGRGYLRTLSGGAGPERAAAARRYVGLLTSHIERENQVLFPMADGLLDSAEHARLARAYREVELRELGPDGLPRILATLDRLAIALSPAERRA